VTTAIYFAGALLYLAVASLLGTWWTVFAVGTNLPLPLLLLIAAIAVDLLRQSRRRRERVDGAARVALAAGLTLVVVVPLAVVLQGLILFADVPSESLATSIGRAISAQAGLRNWLPFSAAFLIAVAVAGVVNARKSRPHAMK